MKHKLDTYFDSGKRIEFCKVCGAESWQLTSECPEFLVMPETRNKVARGELDYANGKWIDKTSKASV